MSSFAFLSVITCLLILHFGLASSTKDLSCDLDTCRKIENCANPPKTESTTLFKSVCLNGGTESRNSGIYNSVNSDEDGVYKCSCCGNELFPSQTKYESHSGWPSFYAPFAEGSVQLFKDTSCLVCGTREEVTCKRCGSHLGHVFDDGPQPTGKRYCMNSVCLDFETNAEAKASAEAEGGTFTEFDINSDPIQPNSGERHNLVGAACVLMIGVTMSIFDYHLN